MRTIMIAALLLLTGCSQSPPPATVTSSVGEIARSLLTADQSAGSASANGLVNLVAQFDDDVVLFAVPVPGFAHGQIEATQTLSRAIGENLSALNWTPVRVGVSADGEHGFTFGYVSAEGAAPYLGKYVAYWVREDGQWRIRLYKLAPRPEGEVSTDVLAPYIPSLASSADAVVGQSFVDSLAAREREFSDASQTEGLRAAFTRFGRPDAVNIGGGAQFTVGAEAIGAIQPDGPSPLTWSADQGVLVAPSGDLGVTWGFLRRNGPTPPGRLSEIPFFTIWARESTDAPWLYIAE